MKRIAYIFVLILLTFFGFGCKKEANDTTIQSTYFSGSDIKGIDITGAWNVTLVQDSTQNYILLEVSSTVEDQVQIHLDHSGCAKIAVESGVENMMPMVLNATIFVSSIEYIHLSDAVQMTSEGDFSGSCLTIEADNASSLNHFSFVGNSAEISATSSSLNNLNLFVDHCSAEISDASEVSGNMNVQHQLELKLLDASQFFNEESAIQYANIFANDASVIDMKNCSVSTMSIVLQNASVALVYAIDILSYDISGSSFLYYRGEPLLKALNLSDGSAIYHIP